MKIRNLLLVLMLASACTSPVPAPTPVVVVTPPVAEAPPLPEPAPLPPDPAHVYDCADRLAEIQAYVDRTHNRNTVLTLKGQVERVYLVDRAYGAYAITHYDGVNLHCAYDVP